MESSKEPRIIVLLSYKIPPYEMVWQRHKLDWKIIH